MTMNKDRYPFENRTVESLELALAAMQKGYDEAVEEIRRLNSIIEKLTK